MHAETTSRQLATDSDVATEHDRAAQTVATGLPDPDAHPELYRDTTMKRAFAWLVDVVIIGAITGLVAVLTVFMAVLLLPLYAVVGFLYRWVTMAGGGTLGHRLMALEFRDIEGKPFGAFTALLHTAGYTASIMIFPLQLVSIALMLMSPRGQGLTDHMLGTAALNRRAVDW